MLSPKAPAGKTYAEWVAHIATRTSRVVAWANDLGGSGTIGVETITRSTASGAPTGDMYGSPYTTSVAGYASGGWAAVSRVAQHSLPSSAAVTEQITNGGQFLIRATQIGLGDVLERTRNGYTSVFSAEVPSRQRVDEFSYWNFATGAPETTNPASGTGPVPYVHAGW